ncbi:methylglyoxal synthase [Bdellovibrionota bacterium]
METLALVAHDGKKAEMVAFIKDNWDFINSYNLVATGTTGKVLKDAKLEVECKKSGPYGGDAQIAAMVAEGKVKAVIFFRDPLDKHPHEPDVQMLMRMCDVHNIPLATNPKAAYYLLIGLTQEKK